MKWMAAWFVLVLVLATAPARADEAGGGETTRGSFGPWHLFLRSGERFDGEVMAFEGGGVRFRWSLAPGEMMTIPIARLDYATRAGRTRAERELVTAVVRLRGGGALFGAVRRIENGLLIMWVDGVGEVAIAVGRVRGITEYDGSARVWPEPPEGVQPVAPIEPDEVDALWDQLASADPNIACDAYLRFTALRDALVPIVAERLPQPPDDPRRIAGLVERLGSPDYEMRSRASWSLVQLGERAVEPLQRAIAGDLSREARSRAHDVIEKIGARGGEPSLEVVRAMRVARMLEHVGTPEAREVLLGLARSRVETATVLDVRLVLWRIDDSR